MNQANAKLFIDQIKERIENNTTLYEQLESFAVSCAWYNLFQATQTLFKCVGIKTNRDANSKDTCCLLILTNSLSDILNALLSMVQGFVRGPNTILRGVVENLALSIVIKNDQKSFSKYCEGKLKPQKTIAPATKIFDEIGKYYGMFSNSFVHEKFQTLGRSMEADGEDVIFSIVPKVPNELMHYHGLLAVAYLSRLTGSLSEYFMASSLADFHYWRKTNDLLIDYKENIEDKMMNELITKYGKLLE